MSPARARNRNALTMRPTHLPKSLIYYIRISLKVLKRFCILHKEARVSNIMSHYSQVTFIVIRLLLNSTNFRKTKSLTLKHCISLVKISCLESKINPTVCSITIGIRNCLLQDVWIPLDSLETT